MSETQVCFSCCSVSTATQGLMLRDYLMDVPSHAKFFWVMENLMNGNSLQKQLMISCGWAGKRPMF